MLFNLLKCIPRCGPVPDLAVDGLHFHFWHPVPRKCLPSAVERGVQDDEKCPRLLLDVNFCDSCVHFFMYIFLLAA